MTHAVEEAWAALEHLADPEIPVISLRELGILRDIHIGPDGDLEVIITPTYSGCPAMGQIEDDVRAALRGKGIPARVVTRLAPAWTTDWITDSGKQKLQAYGIAPPHRTPVGGSVVQFMAHPRDVEAVACPRCGSERTRESSRFGSTACKALYKCDACQEAFDYFKPY